jgi:plasmid maintenance system antidote protein VapI
MQTNSHSGPNALFDVIMARFSLPNDAALARKLGVAPPVVSKIRHARMVIGATLILRIHETFGLAVEEIRAVGNLPRTEVA